MANKDPFDEELMAELGLEPGKAAPAKAAAPKPPVTQQRAPITPPASQPKTADPVTGKTQIVERPKPSAPPASQVSPADNEQVALDMPVQVVAVLGKKTITLKEILSLKQGELFELKKLPQEQIDLVANGKLVARGDLVLIDGKMGLQIKQIIK
ncbi:FliM/FliN family flagellar motor switch protein [bacterium]|nr:FliM/FliN family flagellar motor switch protein [bacterium]